MSSIEKGNLTVAVLIDGDNTQSQKIKLILEHASKFGRITIKKIFADFTIPESGSWSKTISEYGLKGMQQHRSSHMKNSTDSALIIDAMDILHSKSVNAVCLVTGDGDFTALVARLKESHIYVIGLGSKDHTSKALIAVCDEFTYLENLPEVSPLKKQAKKIESIKTATKEKDVVTETILETHIPSGSQKEVPLEIVEFFIKHIKKNIGEGEWYSSSKLYDATKKSFQDSIIAPTVTSFYSRCYKRLINSN